MDIQKMIDDAVEEFRKKLSELFVADAQELNTGTLIIVEDWEVFRILETSDQKPWITYIGEAYSHEQFAELMREQFVKPKIVHNGM